MKPTYQGQKYFLLVGPDAEHVPVSRLRVVLRLLDLRRDERPDAAAAAHPGRATLL